MSYNIENLHPNNTQIQLWVLWERITMKTETEKRIKTIRIKLRRVTNEQEKFILREELRSLKKTLGKERKTSN